MAGLGPIDLGGPMHRLLGTVSSSAESAREAELYETHPKRAVINGIV